MQLGSLQGSMTLSSWFTFESMLGQKPSAALHKFVPDGSEVTRDLVVLAEGCGTFVYIIRAKVSK
jgi:hypothetical protein